MTLKKAIEVLTKYNKWRRGDSRCNQPNTKELGVAIDTVLSIVTKFI